MVKFRTLQTEKVTKVRKVFNYALNDKVNRLLANRARKAPDRPLVYSEEEGEPKDQGDGSKGNVGQPKQKKSTAP